MASSVLTLPSEKTSSTTWLERVLPAVAIFLGAFLLFQVEPIIAKMILPWFGGSAVVWTACMLFFQIALLLGYLYAHWLSGQRRPAGKFVHIGLLAASLLLLPLNPSASWKPYGNTNPLPQILGLLAVAIGLPYFLLSSTSPLVQAWHTRRATGGTPYRLFSLSNLASLLALISYPVLVEPWIPTHVQGIIWSCEYAVFVAALAWLTHRNWGLQNAVAARLNPEAQPSAAEAPTGQQRFCWIILPAAASFLLLAATNHLCQNIAVVPFLWILPLSLYLLSFILCFDHPRWYRRGLLLPLYFMAMALTGYLILKETPGRHFLLHIGVYAGCLFLACMFCHGELALVKPAPRYLTQFYLMISLGSAAGSVLVAIAAPLLLNGVYEFPIGLAACGMLTLMLEYRKSWRTDAAWAALTVWLVVVAWAQMQAFAGGAYLMARSFYGSIRVTDAMETGTKQPERTLIHGSISHGAQLLSPALRREPTGYYARGSGIGQALRGMGDRPLKVGVIGLGAGTMAAYGRPGDEYRFYELDPLIINVAWHQFSFLSDSAAKVETVAGDGRLALERERERRFNLLAVDAFSGDSIPVHLLSREAFQLYFARMAPHGLLAVHVSNSFLDLAPVVGRVARDLGKVARVIEAQEDPRDHRARSVWVLVASEGATLDRLAGSQTWPAPRALGLRAWTDDYSNLFQILK